MKRMLVAAALLLTGCARVGDYQAKCEQQYARMSDMVQCLDRSVKSDSRLSAAGTPKLYVLTARMLSQSVDEGKISEAQARLELQKLYVNLQRSEQADQTARYQAAQQAQLNNQTLNTLQAVEQNARLPVYTPPVTIQSRPMVTTNCNRFGNQVTCQSY